MSPCKAEEGTLEDIERLADELDNIKDAEDIESRENVDSLLFGTCFLLIDLYTSPLVVR